VSIFEDLLRFAAVQALSPVGLILIRGEQKQAEAATKHSSRIASPVM